MFNKDMYIFKPSNKSMKVEYPELSTIKEFDLLTNDELKFVWYYGNQTSPYYNEQNEIKKISQCLKHSFDNSLDENIRSKYLSKNFPDKINIAINRMVEFNPDIRLMAKNSVKLVFNNLNKMITIPETDWADMSYEAKKSYVALSLKITESMPSLVSQLEQGFGVVNKVNDDLDLGGGTIMDRLHMEDSGFDM